MDLRPPNAALWCVNASFIARCTPLTGTESSASMPSSVSAPDAVPYATRLVLLDTLGEYSVCCTCKRALFHSMEDLWKATNL
jgi:hypothetical protein